MLPVRDVPPPVKIPSQSIRQFLSSGSVVNLDKAIVEGAPDYATGAEPTYDRAYGERVYGHYGQGYPFA